MAGFFSSYMQSAMLYAQKASIQGEIPVGAVIVHPKSGIIASAHNMVESTMDSTAHAEIIAIQKASSVLKSKYLRQCSLYVTLEPCPMCQHAIKLCQIQRVYFGASANTSLEMSVRDHTKRPTLEIYAGFMEEESLRLIRDFFSQMRSRKNERGKCK